MLKFQSDNMNNPLTQKKQLREEIIYLLKRFYLDAYQSDLVGANADDYSDQLLQLFKKETLRIIGKDEKPDKYEN